ncbi:MAG: DUF559 domain-containing protein [Bacteroidetes bacterium]|nr:DUF559 domain-containing protein [Bacteroidota bacterium]
MESFLNTPIKFLKGVGPEREKLLKAELNIQTFGDLLHHFPFRYVDRTKFYKVKELNTDLPFVQLHGKIKSAEVISTGKKRLVAKLADDTGVIELVWFQGIKWIAPKLKPGAEFIVFGKPARFQNTFSISHPEMEEASEENIKFMSKLQAVYHTSEKMKRKWLDSNGIWKLQRALVPKINNNIPEILSASLIEKNKFISREEAIKNIHLPQNPEILKRAEFRLKFDELFFIQLRLLQMKAIRKKTYSGFNFSSVGNHFNDFFRNHLPFELTNAQKRVIKEIRTDMATGKQMNRLLQGDVGSGKTIVALMSMLIAIDNGFQACVMAPTEILSMQHHKNLERLLQNTNVKIALLTGSTKKKERTIIHEQLQSGELNILIGTHALVEEVVQFKNLGLAVIDEQHKFGVAHRSRLWKKSSSSPNGGGREGAWAPPHVLVMTATPIPRTLAMTLYGDLDISTIDELPPGRKPIKTAHRIDVHRPKVFQFMKEQIAKGGQVYVVYPIIEESKVLDYENLREGWERITKEFGSLPPSPSQGSGDEKPFYETARPSMYHLFKELQEERKGATTEAEKVLWQCLRKKNLEEYKFRRQHIIDEFIVDFVCLSKLLIIEVDGGYHLRPEIVQADKERTMRLENLGFKIIRFKNEEVIGNAEAVLEKIKMELISLPLGEGRGGAPVRVAMVHGQLPNNVRDHNMKEFAEGKINILVATTVIEVGLDVPNACVMVIESSERFGLSQLHQLRGRVGRGAEESFCILMTGYKLSAEARVRMETMVRTNNGFEIAEVDLHLRGPGDMAGTQQSGITDLHIADLIKDSQILTFSRDIAEKLLLADPDLSLPENLPILTELTRIKKAKPYWGRIS